LRQPISTPESRAIGHAALLQEIKVHLVEIDGPVGFANELIVTRSTFSLVILEFLFYMPDHGGGRCTKGGRQLKQYTHGRLIDSALDQTDKISFYFRLKRQLLLRQSCFLSQGT
jgi:hypothetical protein